MQQVCRALFLLAISINSVLLHAQIYHYQDSSGKKVYVDSLSKVPPEYLDQLTSRDDLKENLTEQEIKRRNYNSAKKSFESELSLEKSRIQEQLDKWITPYKFIKNRVIVPVKVVYGARSKQLSLVMDTGASSTVIHRSAISSLNPSLRRGLGATVADGSYVKTEIVSFDRIEIGPYKSSNIQTMVLDYKGGNEQSHGLLGMDFLFNARYELDKNKSLIIWEPELYVQYEERLKEIEEQERLLKEEPAPAPIPVENN
ncbi:MAG: clan AA aspartic protease [Neptuniibacter sp.]